MKAVLVTLLAILSAYMSNAQVTQYSYHDKDGKKIKEIYQVLDTITNILEGKYLSYHLNGNIESKGNFHNNETVGSWEFYFETGKLKMIGDLSEENPKSGMWKYFFENGEVQMTGQITDQKREGEWQFFFESGQLKEKGRFTNNKREGTWHSYYEDGRQKTTTNYTYDKGRCTEYYASGEKRAEGPKSGSRSSGLWKYFYQNGVIQAEGHYKAGKKIGDWTYFHKNGEVSARGSFDIDKASGNWTYYHENGEVSSKGEFQKGDKSGHWSLFDSDGTLKGETNFKEGVGQYVEYYSSGAIRMKGAIKRDKNNGKWQYFYESGELEGECDFVEGKGTYFGYYRDGTLQTKGIIEDRKKTGKWELYKEDGRLSGYYRPSLDGTEITSTDSAVKPKENRKYGVGEYRFHKKKFKYFDKKVNEFQGFIVGGNPFFTFLGRIPIGFELYSQERLGHEFEFEGLRDPFFSEDSAVPFGDLYSRGYAMAIRQKFYTPKGQYGLIYFGHEVRFKSLNHFSNLSISALPDNVTRASASEDVFLYSLMVGYRLFRNTRNQGFTVDSFISIGTGFRNFKVSNEDFEAQFNELNQNKVPIAFNFGINIGHVFPFGGRGR